MRRLESHLAIFLLPVDFTFSLRQEFFNLFPAS